MRRVNKIIFRFIHDIILIDEKQKMPITFFKIIQNQRRHHHRFASTCCHIEQQMVGRFLMSGKSFNFEARYQITMLLKPIFAIQKTDILNCVLQIQAARKNLSVLFLPVDLR